jgi:hypothetical protein
MTYNDGFKSRTASREGAEASRSIARFLDEMEDFCMVAEARFGDEPSLADSDSSVARACNILRSVSRELEQARKLLR